MSTHRSPLGSESSAGGAGAASAFGAGAGAGARDLVQKFLRVFIGFQGTSNIFNRNRESSRRKTHKFSNRGLGERMQITTEV